MWKYYIDVVSMYIILYIYFILFNKKTFYHTYYSSQVLTFILNFNLIKRKIGMIHLFKVILINKIIICLPKSKYILYKPHKSLS